MSGDNFLYFIVTTGAIDDEMFASSIQDNGYTLRIKEDLLNDFAILKFNKFDVPIKMFTSSYTAWTNSEILAHIAVTANGWED